MEEYIYREEHSNTLDFSKYLGKVFLWMFLAIILTFGTGLLLVYTNIGLNIFASIGLGFLVFPIIQIVIAISLSHAVYKSNTKVVIPLFIIYSVLMGFTFGMLFLLVELSTLILTFGLTSIVFLVMAILGLFTKVDLGKFSSLITVGLITLIVLSIISMFIFSTFLESIICIGGILLFTVITMFDVQRLKTAYASQAENTSITIFGAFSLYLDFINIFIYILRFLLLSRRR